MVNIGKLFATEIIKSKVAMIESMYLDLTVLDLDKIKMNEFWYDCIKRKYIKEQSCATLKPTVLLCTSKLQILTNIYQMI